jgi:hypothetical protein
MQNLPAKALVIAIIGGGFMLTGDLSWLANRGVRVLDAADVATPADATGQIPAEAPLPPARPQAWAEPARPAPAPAATPTRPEADAGIAVAEASPPAGGPEQLAWTMLRPGDRVVLWLAGRGERCLVLDIVDPASGEALAYEAATVSAAGLPLAAAGPPRRVVVGRLPDRDSPAPLIRGGMTQLAPAGIAADAHAGRWIGPIEAITPVR